MRRLGSALEAISVVTDLHLRWEVECMRYLRPGSVGWVLAALAAISGCQDLETTRSRIGIEARLGQSILDRVDDGGKGTGIAPQSRGASQTRDRSQTMPVALRLAMIRSIQKSASPAYAVVQDLGTLRFHNRAHAFQARFSTQGLHLRSIPPKRHAPKRHAVDAGDPAFKRRV